MKKSFLPIMICILSILFLFTGCGKTKTEISPDSPYNFLNYRNEEIKEIEQIPLDSSLSEFCVSYKFTYISDGNNVKGYISIPLSCIQNEKPAKCVLYNRGGNFKIGLLEDDDTAKICQQTNRIVIASQYRGCDGGTGTDEFGGSDVNDVIKLIDFSQSFPFVDMTDYCTMGVSRGGMMSYISAKNDSRIRKIIAVSAVSDLIKSYNKREDMKKILTNCISSTPEDCPEKYKNRSAIYWYDRIKVPTLIIHSKNDEQVSFSQAETLYRKLKENGTKCKFVSYDDNTHGFHLNDKDEIQSWLDE
ncbi:MAG: alpha/beta hydrolase family protein [Acutalibacteraceae bacterium]